MPEQMTRGTTAKSRPTKRSGRAAATPPPPPPNGLSRPQARRYQRLLHDPETYKASSYLDNVRTNREDTRSDVAHARMNLWAAQNGSVFALGCRTWAPLYSVEENTFLLEKGRDKIEQADNASPLDYLSYAAFIVDADLDRIAAIATAHEQAIDWQPSRLRGFRLLLWMAMAASSMTLQLHEQVGLVNALAKRHVDDPYHPIARNLPERLLEKNGGKPWMARDLALKIGTPAMWAEALMTLEDKNGSSVTNRDYSSSCRFARVSDIFTSMSLRELERFLPDYDAQALPDDLAALDTFLRERLPSAEEAVRVAEKINKKRAKAASENKPPCAPSRLVDVLALIALEKDPAFEKADELITFSLVDHEWAKRYASVLSNLPRARQAAIIDRDLADEESTGGGLLLITVDPSLEESYLDAYKPKHVCRVFTNGRPNAKESAATDILTGLNSLSLQHEIARLADDRLSYAPLFTRESLMVLARYPRQHPRVARLFALIDKHLGQSAVDTITNALTPKTDAAQHISAS